MDSIQSSD